MDQAGPPDPDPNPPLRRPPPGACDCHAHVFGGPGEYALDAGRNEDPAPGTLEDYVARYRLMHAALGIERGVLVTSNAYGNDNASTTDALSALGVERYRGIALVGADVRRETLEELHHLGFRGVRINTVTRGEMTLDDAAAMAGTLAEIGLHLQIYFRGADALPALAPAIAALPVPVVIDHLALMADAAAQAGEPGQSLIRLLGAGRIWIKLSGAYRLSNDPPHYPETASWVRTLVAANPEQVIWGTDWPHVRHTGTMPNDGDLLNKLWLDTGDDDTYRRILVDNPTRLYGFEHP